MAFIARFELLRPTNPKEYFLDNHNAIPAAPFLVYHEHPIVSAALRATERAFSSILEAMIRKRATCSTSSTLPRDSGGFHAPRMEVSTLFALPSPLRLALLTSYRVNSRGAWNLFWQASLRVYSRNVRRSKAND